MPHYATLLSYIQGELKLWVLLRTVNVAGEQPPYRFYSNRPAPTVAQRPRCRARLTRPSPDPDVRGNSSSATLHAGDLSCAPSTSARSGGSAEGRRAELYHVNSAAARLVERNPRRRRASGEGGEPAGLGLSRHVPARETGAFTALLPSRMRQRPASCRSIRSGPWVGARVAGQRCHILRAGHCNCILRTDNNVPLNRQTH